MKEENEEPLNKGRLLLGLIGCVLLFWGAWNMLKLMF
jgi:hypothetical protein